MNKPHPMQQFHELLDTVVNTGIRRPNRTGVDTYFIPGMMMKFDMADGFPAITTKKLAFYSMVGELLGFFRGYTSAAQFREIGCKVWDGNANETKSWLANPNRIGNPDFLGRIYGPQWTDWKDWRAVPKADNMEVIRLLGEGYTVIADDGKTVVLQKGINQLEVALKTILTDPTNRRIIVNGWRPDEFDQMALPPCHVAYQFLVDPVAGELHMTLWQRSFDSFLAFNVSEGALFLEIMARLSALKARTFSFFISDCHVYTSHLDQVRELLSRDHRAQPQLVISDRVQPVAQDRIEGTFLAIEPKDFRLEGYDPHPAISAPMAA